MAIQLTAPTQPTPLSSIEQLKAKIATLDAKLVKVHPAHKALLHDIHRMVHADEQLIYLVSPEEISKITSSLIELAGQKILEDKVKAASKKSKATLGQIGLDDI